MMFTTLILMKTIFSSIISIISSIYLNNIFNNSMILLIYLIMYSIYLSIMMYISCSMNSLYILMIMIVFLSGMLIMFSYFISLVNYPFKLKLKTFIQVMFMILVFMKLSSSFYNFMDANLYTNMIKNSDLFLLYTKTNMNLFIIMIIMLISSLILMTKISYIENKTLRKKK
uniref:NADH dehydrogenase subunit 6 n=1 Tax=Apis laboriosa TaxID=183418 RepID=A0A343CZZ9_9HYME|nr:NADH dehydrogenase subunit 6 [Apis laboriosa]